MRRDVLKKYRGVSRVSVNDVLCNVDVGGGGDGDEDPPAAAAIEGMAVVVEADVFASKRDLRDHETWFGFVLPRPKLEGHLF